MTILFILLLKQGRSTVNECKGGEIMLSKEAHHGWGRRERFFLILTPEMANEANTITYIDLLRRAWFYFQLFHSKDLFNMLEVSIFQSSSYRNTDLLMLKYRQIMRQFSVTGRRWNTVIPYIFFSKYRNTRKKQEK